MKRLFSVFLVALFVLVLSACSSGKATESSITLEDIIQAFEASGEEVTTLNADGKVSEGIDKDEKPQFTVIGANDGVIFYMDNGPVKIYEYKDKKELEKAKKENGLIADWDSNGKFLLETRSDKVKEIFASIK